MKRVYSTLGMLAAFAVASAVNVSGVLPEVQTAGQIAPAEKFAYKKEAMKAPVKVSSADDLLGNYMWIGYGALQSSNGYEQNDLQLVKSGDKVIAYGLNIFTDVDVEIEATIDLAQGIVSFPEKVLIAGAEFTGGNDIYFEHMQWNEAGDGVLSVSSPLQLGITDNGDLVFTNERDLIALSVYSGSELLGYYRLLYMNEFVKRPTTLSNEGWEDFGTATLTEDWFAFCPYFDIKVDSYEVKAQRSTENSNIIRLVNPYGEGSPYTKYNYSAAEGEIVLDLSYPNCVIVNGIYEMVLGQNSNGEDVTCIVGNWAGFMTKTEANYPLNYADSYMVMGFTQEDILGELGEESCSFYDAETNEVVIIDPVFTTSGNVSNGNMYGGWTENGQMGVPVIKFSNNSGSVEGIEFDENAPVKYYNFQGVEIANPAKGQLVIKTQGSKAQKMIVK